MDINSVKYVFFDIDGVLSVPIFKGDNGFISGFLDADWVTENIKRYTYDKCKAPNVIKDYVRVLNSMGKKLFCLTTESCSFSYHNKVRFITSNYPEISNQEDILFVSQDQDKVMLIKEIAKRDNIKLSECLLVEDTFRTVLLAEKEGICAMHISHLLDWGGARCHS